MEDIKRSSWKFFEEVIKKFNYKEPDFKIIVGKVVSNMKALGCSMSLKLHFLKSRLSYSQKV